MVLLWGRSSGQVVSELVFSDDPSSNPSEDYSFSVNIGLKRTKIKKKRPGLAHILKKVLLFNCSLYIT